MGPIERDIEVLGKRLDRIGVLHSPRREGSTRLLRIEGMNMDRVKRFPYEAVDALSPAAE